MYFPASGNIIIIRHHRARPTLCHHHQSLQCVPFLRFLVLVDPMLLLYYHLPVSLHALNQLYLTLTLLDDRQWVAEHSNPAGVMVSTQYRTMMVMMMMMMSKKRENRQTQRHRYSKIIKSATASSYLFDFHSCRSTVCEVGRFY